MVIVFADQDANYSGEWARIREVRLDAGSDYSSATVEFIGDAKSAMKIARAFVTYIERLEFVEVALID